MSTRKTLIIATAGHVDHGKTSLVKRLTGTNTDKLAEERERGLTIVPGYAYLHHSDLHHDGANSHPKLTLGFVDVPGHRDFINNMLAGVAAVDAALIVIAADDGIMPQTVEHLAILNFLNVSHAVVALSKTDRVDQKRIETVSEEIQSLLSSTGLAGSPIFPLSNTLGSGIDELKQELWSMLESLNQNFRNCEEEHFRFLIDRSFSVKGIGTVVTGTVKSGTSKSGATKKGELLLHSASAKQCRIRGIRLDENELEQVYKGTRAALNINLEQKLLNRGDWIMDKNIHKPVNRFDCKIKFSEKDYKLRRSAQYHLYIGASHHLVTIRDLGRGYYQIKCHNVIEALYGDRFIIRDPASQHTIGGGMLIDIFVPRRNRNSESRLNFLDAMDQDPLSSLSSLLELNPAGVDLMSFSICRNRTAAALEELISALKNSNIQFIELRLGKQNNRTLLHDKFYTQYCQNILAQISHFHQTCSNQQGISEPALSRAVEFSASHLLFHSILKTLQESAAITQTGTLLHLADHKITLSEEEEIFLATVRPILLEAGHIAPRTRELVDITGISLHSLERVLRLSTKAGTLIKVANNRHYLPETIVSMAEFTQELAKNQEEESGFSVIQFRDKSGIGRNLCIEVLEYFDQIGFTRREGNARFVRTDKENIFGK